MFLLSKVTARWDMNRSVLAVFLSYAVVMTGFEQDLYAQRLLPSIWEHQEAVPAPDLSELKINVIAGEDGVNIVKKKTAVQPVVEVRDRNNVPVSGVVINFTSPNSGPTVLFSNGGHTLSLVTDSAGRATVSGMHPVGTGALHLDVTASVQGHVVAHTTIAQTNFLNAAAGTSGTGAGAGGGLSTAAIIAIVAGVAAGAAVGIGVGLSGKGSPAAANPVSGTISGAGSGTVGGPH